MTALACATEETVDLGVPLGDAEIPELLDALTDGDAAVVEAALVRIQAGPDRRFVPVLIELVRAGQLGIAARAGYNPRVVALEQLSGQALGGDWFGWAAWYAGNPLEPPPGFLGWKGELLGRIDPRFAEILAEGQPLRIRAEEIDWGGVPLDGIPALDNPDLLPADQAEYLAAGEPVLGVMLGGVARAYPLRILDWHELSNDVVGGVPIAITYCTLCGSGIVYDTRDSEGSKRIFGTSGLLYRSNKLMFDRETRSLWSQQSGRPVLGELAADDDVKLTALPSVVTRWGDWRAKHPETSVLSLETGHERPYLPGQPYGSYFQSPHPLFPTPAGSEETATKERIFGISSGEQAIAWPLADLVAAQVTHAEFHGEELVLLARDGRITVEAEGPKVALLRYDAGGAVRAYQSDGHRFKLGPDDSTLLDEEGAEWKIAEEALEGPKGARAERSAGSLAYWFAWRAHHPKTELVVAPESE